MLNYYIILVNKRPGLILVTALLLLGFWASFLPRLVVDPAAEGMFLNHDPVKPAYDRLVEYFGGSNNAVLAVHNNRSLLNAEGLSLLRELQQKLENLPHVLHVNGVPNLTVLEGIDGGVQVTPLIPYEDEIVDSREILKRAKRNDWILDNFLAANGNTATFIIQVEKSGKSGRSTQEFNAELTNLLRETQQLYPQLSLAKAGGPVFVDSLTNAIRADLETFIPFTALFLVLVLFLTFRTIAGVVIPFAVVSVGVAATLGFMAALGFPIATVTVILPPLLLVIGVTNVIHIINAYQEAVYRHPQDTKESQLTYALCKVLGACTLSSLTTAIGFASLALNDVETIFQTGVIACFGIIATYIAAVTITPVTCRFLSVHQLVSTKVEHGQGVTNQILRAIVRTVTKHPITWTLVTSAVAVIISTGYASLKVETEVKSYFPYDSEFRQASRLMEEHLSGSSPGEVLIESGSYAALMEPENVEFLIKLESKLLSYPQIKKVFGPASLLQQAYGAAHNMSPSEATLGTSSLANRQMMFWYEMGDSDILPKMINKESGMAHITTIGPSASSAANYAMLQEMGAWLEENKPQGWHIQFADATARFAYLVETLVPSQMKSLGLAMFVIWLVLIVAMRDIKLASLAMIPNILPIAMILGIMGWTGIALTFATSMIPSIAIGLAVDDTIHVFSQFRHNQTKRAMSIPAAIEATLLETGRAVLFTSVVLFCGFAILVASNFVPNQYFGILTSITTISAIVADLFLAPALLLIMYGHKQQ